MTFHDLVASLDRTVLNVFSPSGSTPTLIIHPQSGSSDFLLQTVTRNPAMEEDFTPGSLANESQGVTELNLFIHIGGIVVIPLRGDTATFGGTDYDVLKVQADREGGAAIRLKRRSQPWNS